MPDLHSARQRVAEFRLQPLGFYYLHDNQAGGASHRMHISLPGGPDPTENDQHQHKFDMWSQVLWGALRSDVFRFLEEQSGGEIEFEVTYADGHSILMNTGRVGKLEIDLHVRDWDRQELLSQGRHHPPRGGGRKALCYYADRPGPRHQGFRLRQRRDRTAVGTKTRQCARGRADCRPPQLHHRAEPPSLVSSGRTRAASAATGSYRDSRLLMMSPAKRRTNCTANRRPIGTRSREADHTFFLRPALPALAVSAAVDQARIIVSTA